MEEITLENCRSINSPGVDFGPAIYRDRLVYLTRPARGAVDPKTRVAYFKLFSAKLEDTGLPGRGKRFSTGLSGNYNEGPVSFTQEDQVVYFTRTLERSGSAVEGPKGEINLGLFSAYHDQFDWAAVRPMPYNNVAYTNQHPAVTQDGRRIYFASNRPGGFGGYDLYFADYRNGVWGEAINLGPEINTDGNEAFPHIHASGRLFFASDGHPGMGGFDLFSIDLSQRRWGQLHHLPDPINSPLDDITFILNMEGTTGYLASNRPGGLGKDDIYKVSLRNGLKSLATPIAQSQNITLYDAETSKRLSDALVWVGKLSANDRLPAFQGSFSVSTINGKKVIEQLALPPGFIRDTVTGYTDLQGKIAYPFERNSRYHITVAKPGYASRSFYYGFDAQAPPGLLDLGLEPLGCFEVFGKVVDSGGAGMPGARVRYYNEDNLAVTVQEVISDDQGNYRACLSGGANYTAAAAIDGMETVTSQLPATAFTTNRPTHHFIRVSALSESPRVKAAYRNAVLKLPEIYYPRLSANPELSTSTDLPVLLKFLLDFPMLKVLLIVYADGAEDAVTLQRLAEERAIRLRLYLEEQGVRNDRISTVAYGGKFPLASGETTGANPLDRGTRIEAKVIEW